MHRLEEIRYDDGSWILEVDQNGIPLCFAPAESLADSASVPHYQCECGHAFASWEEAKAHIELYNPGKSSSDE
jgi:hypothetical protein